MIPVCEPFLTEDDIALAIECLRSGWISSSGKYIEQFERLWANYCGMPYYIAVSNGAVTLQLAVKTLGLKEGDEVIMPTFTIISCTQALIYNGIKPVLIDTKSTNWQMDVSRIEDKFTNKTRAMRYFFLPEIMLMLQTCGLTFLHAYDFDDLSKKPSVNSWNIICIAKK